MINCYFAEQSCFKTNCLTGYASGAGILLVILIESAGSYAQQNIITKISPAGSDKGEICTGDFLMNIGIT